MAKKPEARAPQTFADKQKAKGESKAPQTFQDKQEAKGTRTEEAP